MRSVVTSSRNIKSSKFFPSPSPNQGKNEIFDEIEKLKEKNNVLEEHNRNLENKVSDLEVRIERLYRDKEDLETLLANFDDNEREQEMFQMQLKNEEKVKKQYETEIEMLRESMGELGHQNIKLEIKNKELEKKIEELSNQKEIWEDREKYYREHFVHKDKYNSLNVELGQFKTENTNLDSRIVFRNIRVKELEKKIQSKEQEYKVKLMDVESKLKDKLNKEKHSAENEIKRLNKELSNAKTALSNNGVVPVQDTELM
jgi:chromosome segregation ATPase